MKKEGRLAKISVIYGESQVVDSMSDGLTVGYNPAIVLFDHLAEPKLEAVSYRDVNGVTIPVATRASTIDAFVERKIREKQKVEEQIQVHQEAKDRQSDLALRVSSLLAYPEQALNLLKKEVYPKKLDKRGESGRVDLVVFDGPSGHKTRRNVSIIKDCIDPSDTRWHLIQQGDIVDPKAPADGKPEIRIQFNDKKIVSVSASWLMDQHDFWKNYGTGFFFGTQAQLGDPTRPYMLKDKLVFNTDPLTRNFGDLSVQMARLDGKLQSILRFDKSTGVFHNYKGLYPSEHGHVSSGPDKSVGEYLTLLQSTLDSVVWPDQNLSLPITHRKIML